MRLDFNVLWVEDQPQAVKAQCERIGHQLRKEGFRLQAKFARSVDEAKQDLSSDVYGDHIDLVVMDYDLGVGAKGDEGLSEVRRVFRYKDIVFYSALSNDLRTLVKNRNIEGVFCSARNDLPDTIEGVFEALVKKVLDIDHCRGIVMGATSDIDQLVNDCLVSLYEQGNMESQNKALAEVAKRLKDIRKSFEKQAEKVAAVRHVSELFEYHAVYTSSDRLRLLRKVLAASGKHNDKDAAMKKYADDTVPKRNDLAHVRVTREGFSRKLLDRNGNELTTEQMRELRAALLEYQEMMEFLSTALKSA